MPQRKLSSIAGSKIPALRQIATKQHKRARHNQLLPHQKRQARKTCEHQDDSRNFDGSRQPRKEPISPAGRTSNISIRIQNINAVAYDAVR
jgi:hypothetical protein